jgi:putative ABC transport system substrate-binding protein
MPVISIRRRRLVFSAGGMIAAQVAGAQPLRAHRILWLSLVTEAAGGGILKTFIDGMAALGYVQGRNLIVDARWGDGSVEALERSALEALALQPAVIVTQGPALFSARKLPGPIPVVFGSSGDPVEAGIVKSLGRPGGRFTGVTFLAYDLVGKRVELLHEVLPRMKRLGVLSRPDHAGDAKEVAVTREAASRFGLEVLHYPANNVKELETALTAIAAARVDGLVIHPDAIMIAQRAAIAKVCMEQRIAAISGWAVIAEGGILMTYGPNLQESYRRLAYFVDRVLRGTNPAELPVEQPTRFEFVINLKTAKALGLTLPPTIMVRADRLIE